MQLFALLPCDGVHTDPETGKHSIIGHFGSIKASKFPTTHEALKIFIGLSDMEAGEHAVEIHFGHSPEDMAPILEDVLESKGEDQRIYMVTEITDIVFEKPGTAMIELWVDGEPLGACTLSATR